MHYTKSITKIIKLCFPKVAVLLLVSVATLFMTRSNASAFVNEAIQDKFAQNDIIFYNPGGGNTCATTGGGNTHTYCTTNEDGSNSCTAGMLAGNTIEERIWNYFVSAQISGLSDNPAVIAGILGNLYVESGYNPFMVSESGNYRGLYMLSDTYGGAFHNAMDDIAICCSFLDIRNIGNIEKEVDRLIDKASDKAKVLAVNSGNCYSQLQNARRRILEHIIYIKQI